MGDLTATFTSAIVPAILSASARCSINTNSHDSDLGVGLAYTPADLPITVRARYDSSRRWGVLATVRLPPIGKLDMTCTAGISGSDLSGPRYGAVVSIEI